MQLSRRVPFLVPFGADQTVYVVVDRVGAAGAGSSETEIERTDLESIIVDLLSGRFSDPVRVIAFNTLEHWSEDVSAEVAREIQIRCDVDGDDLPEHLEDFVESTEVQSSMISPPGASFP